MAVPADPTTHIGVPVCLSDVGTVTHVVETTPRQLKRNPARCLHFARPPLLFSYPPFPDRASSRSP